MGLLNEYNDKELERIIRYYLNEQSGSSTGATQTTGSTTPTTGNTNNTQTGSTTPTTGNTTNTQTGGTSSDVVDFGSDSNAKKIEKKVDAEIKANENFQKELNKIKFLFGYERGVVLSEQLVKKNLFESDGSDTENAPYDAPIVTVTKLNNTEWRVFAFGTFPVNVTSGPLATNFMNAIVNAIYQDPILSKPEYKGRIVMTVAHVFGGASNYNSGPVKPDMDAVNKGTYIEYTPSKITDTSIFTGKYETNTQLAKNRAINLFNVIKAQLPLRTTNKILITAKPVINGYNVNTGNVVDKDRNSSLYPVPGQHVNMALIIKIKPKKPSKVGSLECMKNLRVTVKSTKHQCDTAAFDVKLNGIALGTVDLGNDYVGTTTPEPVSKKTRNILAGSQTDGKKAGVRWRSFLIAADKAASYVTSADGSVKISLKGKDSAHYEQRFGLGSDQSYAGKISSHADVPYVVITKADGTVIYDQAPTPNTYAFGGSRKPCGTSDNPCQEFDLIKFNPCATNSIDGDLTGF